MLPTSTHRTSEEIKNDYVSQMGGELGSLFHALWQEVAWLHNEWHEYVQLFGTKQSRVALMNEAAPAFFGIIQQELLQMIVLRIARLTDPPKSAGKSNLTIRQLPEKIDDRLLRQKVTDLINTAVAAANFCRERRHRHIAHRALDVSLGVTTDPLPNVTRENISSAMASLAEVLNAVSHHYLNSTTDFALISNLGGAVALIRILDDGVQKKMERIAGLKRGELPADNIRRQRL